MSAGKTSSRGVSSTKSGSVVTVWGGSSGGGGAMSGTAVSVLVATGVTTGFLRERQAGVAMIIASTRVIRTIFANFFIVPLPLVLR
jgi:hypothetical protein